jgi:translocation and assembly module TamA
VQFVGVENRKILAAMRAASLLLAERKRVPQSFPALQYRAESDRKRMLDVLHSFGYYSAQIFIRYERESDPQRVVLVVHEGPIYPLVSFDLIEPELEDDPWVGMRYPLETIEPEQLGLQLGKPAVAEQILEAEAKILRLMDRCGYLLAKVTDQEAIVDVADRTVAVTVTVDSGPLCTFGPLSICGLRKVRRKFVVQCLGWRQGQRFDPKRVEKTILYLRRSGLFRGIRVVHAPEAEADGQLPVTIELEERKARTIAVGISYNIDQGFGPEFEWEHRNLFGMGEDLNVRVTTGNRKQEAGIYFRKPHFGHCDRDLLLGVQATHENVPGYTSKSISVHALIDRVLNKHWAYSYGIEPEQLSVKKSNNNGDFTLVEFPIDIRLLTVDDMLDPKRGFKVLLKLRPTVNVIERERIRGKGDVRFYSKQQLWGAVYQALDRRKRIVLALWGTIGTIWGGSDVSIPPPKRFYAGSDTTLRGYSYQTVGPLNAARRPIGGRSLLVVGIEPRVRVSENWGFAVFYEAGNVYKNPWPDFAGKWLQSVGAGPRYYTPVGPISLDIAVPINRRPGVDRPLQVYVNIGQTF